MVCPHILFIDHNTCSMYPVSLTACSGSLSFQELTARFWCPLNGFASSVSHYNGLSMCSWPPSLSLTDIPTCGFNVSASLMGLSLGTAQEHWNSCGGWLRDSCVLGKLFHLLAMSILCLQVHVQVFRITIDAQCYPRSLYRMDWQLRWQGMLPCDCWSWLIPSPASAGQMAVVARSASLPYNYQPTATPLSHQRPPR